MFGKRRLVLVVTSLLVVGFVATALASYFVSKASLREQIIHSGLPLTSDNIYSEIQKDLLPPIFVASMMAQDTFLRDWVLGGEHDLGQITHYLTEVRRRYHTVSAFFVSERSHHYYHPAGILKDVSAADPRDKWYFRVRKMQPEYEINIDPDQANHGTLTVFINHKVYDYNGKFIGATGVGLKVSAMLSRIEQYEKRYGRSIYFADRQGNITLDADRRTDDTRNLRSIPGIEGIADRILASDHGSFSYQRNGEEVLLNTRFIPEFGWYMLVEEGEGMVTAEVRHALILNLVVGLSVALVVALLIHFTIIGYQRRLERMATIDPLTGIATRQAFEMLAEQSIRETTREREAVSLIFFDIDHFKEVNDRHGHLVGDEVLKGVVELARGALRAADVVCRWGGEEFVLWLRSCTRADAEALAEKVRAAIEAHAFSTADEAFHVTVSLGVTEYRPGESVAQTLDRVDDALYAAKERGRNRVEAV